MLSVIAGSRRGGTCDHDQLQSVFVDVASFPELRSEGLRDIHVVIVAPVSRGQLTLVAGTNLIMSAGCRSGCIQHCGGGAQSLRVCGIFVGVDVDVCVCRDALVRS